MITHTGNCDRAKPFDPEATLTGGKLSLTATLPLPRSSPEV